MKPGQLYIVLPVVLHRVKGFVKALRVLATDITGISRVMKELCRFAESTKGRREPEVLSQYTRPMRLLAQQQEKEWLDTYSRLQVIGPALKDAVCDIEGEMTNVREVAHEGKGRLRKALNEAQSKSGIRTLETEYRRYEKTVYAELEALLALITKYEDMVRTIFVSLSARRSNLVNNLVSIGTELDSAALRDAQHGSLTKVRFALEYDINELVKAAKQGDTTASATFEKEEKNIGINLVKRVIGTLHASGRDIVTPATTKPAEQTVIATVGTPLIELPALQVPPQETKSLTTDKIELQNMLINLDSVSSTPPSNVAPLPELASAWDNIDEEFKFVDHTFDVVQSTGEPEVKVTLPETIQNNTPDVKEVDPTDIDAMWGEPDVAQQEESRPPQPQESKPITMKDILAKYGEDNMDWDDEGSFDF